MVRVIKEKCNGCGQCVDFCGAETISLVKGKAVIDQDICVKCLACISVCPNKAIVE